MKSLFLSVLTLFLSGVLFAQTWHSKFDYNTQAEDGGAMGTVGNVGIGFFSPQLNLPAANIIQPETPYLPQKQLHIIGYEDTESPEFIAPKPTIRLDHRTISSGVGGGGSGSGTERTGGPDPSHYFEYTAEQHVWDIENNRGVLSFVKDGSQKIKYSRDKVNFGVPTGNETYDLNIYGTVSIGLTTNSYPGDLIVNGPSTLKGVLKSQNQAFFENQVIIGNPAIIHSAQSNPNNILVVQGTGVFQEVVVDHVSEWNDKVFLPDYNLLQLPELESFISKNGHLPDVPKEEEVIQYGYDMAKMDAILLKKIEELTLHVIALNKENELLKSRIK